MCRVRGVAIWELNGPRQTTDFAVATTGHEAADPSKGVAEGETWGERVECRPERHFFSACENPYGYGSADERAVKHHAGSLQKKLYQRLFAIPMVNDEKYLCPRDATYENPDHEIGEVFRVDANLHAAATGGPEAHHEPYGQQNAVPVDR